jgi:hypothetical protein
MCQIFKTSKIFYAFIIGLALLVTSSLTILSGTAHAVTITANTQARIDTNFFVFTRSLIDSSESYVMNFKIEDGTIKFGNLNASGDLFDTIAIEILAMSTIEVLKFNPVTRLNEVVPGSLTGSYVLNFSNVSFDAPTNQFAAMEGVSSASLIFNAGGTIEGQNVQFAPDTLFDPGFLRLNAGQFDNAWKPFVDIFGENGSASFSLSYRNNQISISPTAINQMSIIANRTAFLYSYDGTNLEYLSGSPAIIDFDGTSRAFQASIILSSSFTDIDVPEPATLGLLFSGLIGAAASRRMKRKNIAS